MPTSRRLHVCDQEPIHIPGAIQPHGFLIVCDPATYEILAVSQNIESLFLLPAQELLGQALERFLPADYLEIINRSNLEFDSINPFQIQPLGLEVIAHCNAQQRLVIEFEPRIQATPRRHSSSYHELSRLLHQLEFNRSLPVYLSTLSLRLRCLLSFDRVLIYRFHPDGHGEVIAEAVDPEQDSFLGFHFPASDIPAQARALYSVNPVRLIPDAHYTPVALEQSPGLGAVDLTFATLRSVSPWHRQYLQDMGVRSSMSISIIVAGQLWGLIMCHKQQAQFVDYETRSFCTVIAKLIGAQLAAHENALAAELRSVRLGTIIEFVKLAHASASISEGISGSQIIAKLFTSCGFARLGPDGIEKSGETPSANQILQLAERLSWQPDQEYWHHVCDSMRAEYPDLDLAPIAGFLAVSLRNDERDERLFIFRKEVLQTLNWGRHPQATPGSMEQMKFGPLYSFARWQEERREHSLPWTLYDRESALELGRAIAFIAKNLQADARLKRLLSRLDAIKDQQDRWLSENLRENVGQLLAALKLELTTLNDEITGLHSAQRLARLIELSDEGLQRLNQLSWQLWPPVFEHLGFHIGLNWYFDELRKQEDIRVIQDWRAFAISFDPAVGMSVFKILRGWIDRLVRENCCKRLIFRASSQGERGALVVSDDCPKNILATDHLDILEIHERAQRLGMAMHLDFIASMGHTLTLTFDPKKMVVGSEA